MGDFEEEDRDLVQKEEEEPQDQPAYRRTAVEAYHGFHYFGAAYKAVCNEN